MSQIKLDRTMSYPREITPQEFEEFRALLYREMYKTE